MKTVFFLVALLLVGGCQPGFPQQEIDSNAIADTNYTINMADFDETIPSPPCPPCPDSTSMQSYIIIDGTRMPEGTWVKPKIVEYQVGDYEYEMKDSAWVLFRWPKNNIPDSVFILSGEGE